MCWSTSNIVIKNNNVGISCNKRTCLKISDAIEDLLENKSKQSQLSENCLKLYEKSFSYDYVYSQLVDKIEEIVSIRQ